MPALRRPQSLQPQLRPRWSCAFLLPSWAPRRLSRPRQNDGFCYLGAGFSPAHFPLPRCFCHEASVSSLATHRPSDDQLTANGSQLHPCVVFDAAHTLGAAVDWDHDSLGRTSGCCRMPPDGQQVPVTRCAEGDTVRGDKPKGVKEVRHGPFSQRESPGLPTFHADSEGLDASPTSTPNGAVGIASVNSFFLRCPDESVTLVL